MQAKARGEAELRAHYEVEKELSTRLREASRKDRLHLYNEVYDELFRRVPTHPQLTRKIDPQEKSREVAWRLGLLKGFLRPDVTYLEVGAGDCSLSFEVARWVKKVYAVEVSEEIAERLAAPANFSLVISDGLTIPVPAGDVDLAYSNQLMEHLHPDDAFEQLRNIARSLVPGGKYLCVTPNRLCGPHDISMYFDREATGLHLREYTNRDLVALFKRAGFTTVKAMVAYHGSVLFTMIPVAPVLWFEWILERLPYAVRRRAGQLLIAVKLVAIK